MSQVRLQSAPLGLSVLLQPVQVQPNTTYVASYFAPNGHCSYDTGYFSSAATTSGDLTAPKTGGSDGPNGVYVASTTSSYPNHDGAGTNYWVDVLFTKA